MVSRAETTVDKDGGYSVNFPGTIKQLVKNADIPGGGQLVFRLDQAADLAQARGQGRGVLGGEAGPADAPLELRQAGELRRRAL